MKIANRQIAAHYAGSVPETYPDLYLYGQGKKPDILGVLRDIDAVHSKSASVLDDLWSLRDFITASIP